MNNYRGFRFTEDGTRFLTADSTGKPVYIAEAVNATVYSEPDEIAAIDSFAGMLTVDESGEHYSTGNLNDVLIIIAQVYHNELDAHAYYTSLPTDGGGEDEEEIVNPTLKTFKRFDRVVIYGVDGVDLYTDFFLLKTGRTIVSYARTF